MKNLQLFAVFLFIFSVMLFSQSAKAAYTATPAVDGLSGGTYKPLSMPNLTGSNFQATGKVLINGKLVNIPGYIPPASTAAQAAKTSLWLNPWLVGASLLAWADDAGLGSDMVSGVWIKTSVSGEGTASCSYYGSTGYGPTWAEACGAIIGSILYNTTHSCPINLSLNNRCIHGPISFDPVTKSVGYIADFYCSSGSCTGGLVYGDFVQSVAQSVTATTGGVEAAPVEQPATQADFDALPNPVPEVYRELAPQVGVPVDSPIYNPVTVEIGDPYTKPDGSTAQPMAQISPASNGQVTIDTFDQPLTDPQGNPTPTAPPVDTVEPPPEQPTQCDKYPGSLGCANLDTPATENLLTETRDIALISPVSVGGAGTCPASLTASFLGQTVEMSFDPLCQFANALRPVVLVLAWLSAGVIFIGGVRNG